MNRHKVYTLKIPKRSDRHLSSVGTEPDIDVEVDYDLTGFIYEIRVWSDHFEDHIPVVEMWLTRNYPSKMESIKKSVDAVVEQALFSQKQFNNDDPNPAA